MKNPQEDDQLLFELEDLYLSSKHWLSDLEFLERNLEFLQKLYGKAFFQILKQDDTKMITKILTKVSEISTERLELKTEVQRYLKKLEPLITNLDQNFDISVSNTHIELERRISDVFSEYKIIKKTVYNFAKWSLKGEYIDKHLLTKRISEEPQFKLLEPLFSSMDDAEFSEEELQHFCYNTDDTRG